jgi:uncharacterized protein (DUF2126 family)
VKALVESYALHVTPPCRLRWQKDPAGNHVARVSFRAAEKVSELDVLVELTLDVRPVNPFDFFLDRRCDRAPFTYPDEIARDLAPYLDRDDTAYAGGPRLDAFLAELPREGKTVDLVVALNQAVKARLKYVIREEAGVWTPEQTLAEGRGSCRDSAVLLVAALRSRGIAARFVSGYLVQLTDEGLIPDEPKGVDRDVVDLHAWAEAYLPGGGWIGFDATSGLLCGEGHVPLACTAGPSAAAPMDGTSDVTADDVLFEVKVGRLGHEARPTAPFSEATWSELAAAGDRVDAALAEAGVVLTVGGEPTFTSRLHPTAPEWNGDALGPTKTAQGRALTEALRARLAPGGIILERFGKHYPGESLPRWALDVVARTDGAPLARRRPGDARGGDASLAAAERLAQALARKLGVDPAGVTPAFEDPWHYLREEARLPVSVDPHDADLMDSDDRRRLARILDRDLRAPVGYVIPIEAADASWRSTPWQFRRERLYLLPGDSPVGLRLPLDALRGDPPEPPIEEAYTGPQDPRRAELEGDGGQASRAAPTARAARTGVVRTALAVEPREGRLYVFLPPVPSAERFIALVQAVDTAAAELDLRVAFEGYPPPRSPALTHFAVTPDPGVIEVNIPPTRTSREHVALMEEVFAAALEVGLHAQRFQLDGRTAGSGGGNHVTLGGPTPLASPFLQRPDLLASLVTFTQHHPSLSYLFSGLFVGPTSQAPRVDEARHDSLYELEIAMARAFSSRGVAEPPWLADALFRHLLVDVAGNTHRAEICIDKLFAPGTPHGRQGLVELRAFEMPPHVRMAAAQIALVRALVASFVRAPYRAPLVRWGTLLHDRFLLPTLLWRDLEDVRGHLERAGLPLPSEAYRAFLELRCPLVGALSAGDVRIEIRNAIEPWHVLGEEASASGTVRYVDSSVERVEVRAVGLVPERHLVTVNGHALPLHETGTAGERAGGVRFRAWAPPHSLHAHLGIHHPLRFDVLDTWAKRSLGACAYHVWHPEGRGFGEPPLTRQEAEARRAQRFTLESHAPWPATARPAPPHGDGPYTLDLRRFAVDHPIPEPAGEDDDEGEEAP